MDIQSLIRLAHQADLEGNYRVADKLTERAIREANWLRNVGTNLGDFFGTMTGNRNKDLANMPLIIGDAGPGGNASSFAGSGARAGDVFSDVMQEANSGAASIKAQKPKKKNPAPAAGTTPGTTPGATPAPAPGTTPAPTPGTTPAPAPGTGPGSRPNHPGNKNQPRGGGGRFVAKSGDAGNTNAPSTGAGGAGGASGPAHGGSSGHSGIYKQDRFKSHDITGITGGQTAAILGTGAAGMLGAQYLANRQGPGPAPTPGPGPMPPVMPGMKGQDFKANQLAERSQADQMQDAQLAQNFIQVRKGLPNFTTAQDFYYAAQAAGMTPGQMNQVAALAKAEGFRDKTPMMN
jgi:hypothetical protein